MTARPVLYVLIGPPGAGKSTYARQTFPPDWIVCADDVRERMTKWRRDDPVATWKYVEPVKREVQVAVSRALRQRLEAGQATVYDNTNVRKRNRETLLRGLLDQGAYDVRYVVLDRPLESKLADRAWRPEGMIRDQHQLFLDELPDILAGDGRPYVTVEDRRVRS